MKTISVLMYSVLLTSCFSKKPEATGKEGQTLPAFDILLTDSITHFNTNSIKPDKPLVVFLFGPNCPYSKAEIEDIIDNSDKLKNIQFLAITPYQFNEMKEFYVRYKLHKYTNIITGIDTNNFFADYMGVSGVPYIALYNKEKKLIKAWKGKTDISNIKNNLE